MSSWNEDTKTLSAGDGRELRLNEARGFAASRDEDGAFIYFGAIDPADLEAFGRAVLAAAGEPVPRPTPAPFKENAAFEDVQVGDRVRLTRNDGDVLECTVGKVTGYYFDSESGDVAAVERDDCAITILSRPEPPKAELPTEPGARIVVEAVTPKGKRILDLYGGSCPGEFERYDSIDAIWFIRHDSGKTFIGAEQITAWHPAPEPELPTLAGSVVRLSYNELTSTMSLGLDGLWRGSYPGLDDSHGTRRPGILAAVRGTLWDKFEVEA